MIVDTSTFPLVNVKEGKWGNLSIIKVDEIYRLFYEDVPWYHYAPDTNREIYEQWSGYDLAYGDVLISGFGFGHMANWLSNKPEVKNVYVIEKYQEVITAYLESNSLPDNVYIIIDDANTYSTDKKYDCIIWDHISDGAPESNFYKELCHSAKKIKHDLFWFWSLEFYYVKFYYGMTIDHYGNDKFDFNQLDFGRSWEKLRQVLDMPTIPTLSKDKIDAYVKTYFMRV